MRTLLAILLIFSYGGLFAQDNEKGPSIHFKSVLVDTHNDVLSSQTLEGHDISHRLNVGHSDLDRWKEGGLDVQFFSIWTGEKARNPEGFFKDAMQEVDSLKSIVARNPDRMVLPSNYKEVKKGIHQHKLVCLIGVEGGHMIENDIDRLSTLLKGHLGYLTLTWNNSTSWATSARDETERADSLSHKGLTEFGRKIVKAMNDRGIIIDLSHTGEQTFYDAIATSTKPVLLSHSSVWNICPVFRNLKDDQIKAVAKNGGVICINFYSGFISKDYDQLSTYLDNKIRKPMQDSLFAVTHDSAVMKAAWKKYYDGKMNTVRPTIGQVVDHIDYIVHMIGDDYVGIGSDFDGVSSLPTGLEDVTTYPKITEELIRRGYSNRSIRKILGANVLRVMKANFK